MNQSFVIRFFLSAPHETLDSRGAPHRTNADTKDFFSFLKRRSSPSSSSSICFPLDKRWKGNETNRFSDLELESLCAHSIKKGFFFIYFLPTSVSSDHFKTIDWNKRHYEHLAVPVATQLQTDQNDERTDDRSSSATFLFLVLLLLCPPRQLFAFPSPLGDLLASPCLTSDTHTARPTSRPLGAFLYPSFLPHGPCAPSSLLHRPTSHLLGPYTVGRRRQIQTAQSPTVSASPPPPSPSFYVSSPVFVITTRKNK